MGIPSYFSHFVRQHRRIIKQLSTNTKPINNLYLDCNGFIYEAVNSDRKNMNEDILIKYVCDKLIYHINLLKPNKNVFIAFDGVAPVAKLDQQRKRRFISWFQTKTVNDYSKNDINCKNANANANANIWNTSAITPGTLFMKKLTSEIKTRFNNPNEFALDKFIISCSDEVGEGEHKIFSYIRKYAEYHAQTNTVIYGLDADLIMLTLNHLYISDNLYLFRETPEFIKTIDNTLNPNELYLLDIPEFGKSIVNEFTVGPLLSGLSLDDDKITSTNKINDYIFIFFLLGNDFLPHFPALNIRTNGIDILLNAYKHVLNSKNLFLIVDGKIIWKHFRLFIEYISSNELTYIKKEYALRDKHNGNSRHNNRLLSREKEFENKLINLPTTDRAVELYINPKETGWEERYYHSLFELRIDDTRRKEICVNYLEGLEWTFKYYSSGCVDWRWTYKYDYPPLLEDLIKHIPYFDKELFTNSVHIINNKAVSESVQLGYVLPRQSLGLIPNNLGDKLLKAKPEWYVDNCDFNWAFCRYFWEAHVDLPHIDIKELEEFLAKNKIC